MSDSNSNDGYGIQPREWADESTNNVARASIRRGASEAPVSAPTPQQSLGQRPEASKLRSLNRADGGVVRTMDRVSINLGDPTGAPGDVLSTARSAGGLPTDRITEDSAVRL